MFSSEPIALSADARTAGSLELVANEPPEMSLGGSMAPKATSTLSRNTGLFGCNLREVRVGAVPISGATGDAHGAVIPELDSRFRGKPRREPGATGHLTECEAIALHRTDLRCPLRPTNFSLPRSRHSSMWRDENGRPERFIDFRLD